MFEYDATDEFRKILEKLKKKDPVIAVAINKKIKEIITRDKDTINAYKNLKHSLKNFKRIHITKSLIMIFEVKLNENLIIFNTIKHRDDAYKE